ncbi:hypothetical protein [Mesorhizobium sp. B4-1-1]|uniref:hypothetical protein n=1 Tax=Mesorhizobium sp. B4-1-1 TaxID=2589890 RepID=UPI001128C483|nr:hypothetical protein [Mesorhizobium sp. B4-1-1]TPI15595.1 hypothetical protein FJW10_24285 [Mesorhizobium sp. B4-1-1]
MLQNRQIAIDGTIKIGLLRSMDSANQKTAIFGVELEAERQSSALERESARVPKLKRGGA